MGGNLWSFREFFSRREAGGAESQTEKRSTTPKRDTGNESIKKASRSDSEWLKKSMKGKTNCEKRSGTLLLNFDYAKLDIFLSMPAVLIPSFPKILINKLYNKRNKKSRKSLHITAQAKKSIIIHLKLTTTS